MTIRPPRQPRITVVTPSFNQAQFIESTIRSVLDQEYENLEYIVLDAGSTDGSVDIIRRYRDTLAYWRSAPDAGQSAALREGFEMATGDIFAWLNSDDMLAPGSLAAIASTWLEHGPGVIITGACQLIDGDVPGKVHHPGFQRHECTPEPLPLERLLDIGRHWSSGEFFYQPEVFFPAEQYHTVGGVDPSFHLTMDYDLWVRFGIAKVPVVVLRRTLAMFREHDAQKTAARQPVYAELVATANSYLDSPLVELPTSTKRRLRVLNKAALHKPVRGAWKILRRLHRP